MILIISNEEHDGTIDDFLEKCSSNNIKKIELFLDEHTIRNKESIYNLKTKLDSFNIEVENLKITLTFNNEEKRNGSEHILGNTQSFVDAKLAVDALRILGGKKLIMSIGSDSKNAAAFKSTGSYASSEFGSSPEYSSLNIGFDINDVTFDLESILEFNDLISYYIIGPVLHINEKNIHSKDLLTFLDLVNNCELKIQNVYLDECELNNRIFFQKLSECYFDNFTCSLETYLEILETKPEYINFKPNLSNYDFTKQSYPSSISRLFTHEGNVNIYPSTDILAGMESTWQYQYTVGKKGIATLGGIRFRFHHSTDWSDYNITLNYSGDADLVMSKDNSDFCISININCIDGTLEPGEKIELILGDKTLDKTKAQTFEQKDFRFYTLVDSAGKGYYKETFSQPTFKIVGNSAKKLGIVCPSIIRENQKIKVKIRVEDQYFNRASNYSSEIELRLNDHLITSVTLSNESTFVTEIDGFTPGIYRIEAYDAKNNIQGRSNPIKVVVKDSNQPNIYWGDIHGHAALMDGVGTPDDYYEHARDFAFMDICSLSDHIDNGDDFRHETYRVQWEMIKESTKKYNNPGDFSTILGYECSQSWDANIYYNADDAPYYVARDPQKLIHHAMKYDAIMIPHMTSYPVGIRGFDWTHYNEKVMPILEIYSIHGASEKFGGEYPLNNCEPGGFAVEALDRGCKYGFIGSGDGHEGKPGYGTWGRHANGIFAMYAPKLERDDFFNAMRERYCYATTNARILLDYSINGTPMGGEIKYNQQPRKICVEVHGTDFIESIEVIKNGNVIFCTTEENEDIHFEFIDYDDINIDTYYYIKVKQVDGNIAWASPIFLNYK